MGSDDRLASRVSDGCWGSGLECQNHDYNVPPAKGCMVEIILLMLTAQIILVITMTAIIISSYFLRC